MIKGDGRFRNIAAASILAKTTRDAYMKELHEAFPEYQWRKNKGYPHSRTPISYSKIRPTPITENLFDCFLSNWHSSFKFLFLMYKTIVLKTFFSPTPFLFFLPITVSLTFLFLVQLLFFLFASCEQNRLNEVTFQLIPHDAMAVIQVNDYIELTPALEKNSILKYWKEAHPVVTEVLSKITPKELRSGDLYVFLQKEKIYLQQLTLERKEKMIHFLKTFLP